MKPHQKLDVWRKSISFVKQIYELTGSYPAEEKFGLVSQMRRAAISIPSNISEGAARSSQKEFIHFLYISQGSASELETQIIISKELSFITPAVAESILNDLENISKMII
jgi:four helix bundle protein